MARRYYHLDARTSLIVLFGEPGYTIGCTDANGPHYSQLTPDANRSGSPGLGARQWVGPEYTNGFGINFTPTSSVNIRWYERYDPGIDLGQGSSQGRLHKGYGIGLRLTTQFPATGRSERELPHRYSERREKPLCQSSNKHPHAHRWELALL